MKRLCRLLDDHEHIWDVFASSEILSMDNFSVIWAGKAASALPMAVLVDLNTDQNSHERVLEANINNECHQLLLNYAIAA